MELSVTLQEDIDSFSLTPDQIEKLRGSRVVVTGATGLIGSMVVRCLAAQNCGIRLIALVRNRLKADAMFADLGDKVLIEDADICQYFDGSPLMADYVIHCASPTNGRYISDHPAQTYLLAITTMRAILEYARRNRVKGVVYLSSIEVCGQIFDSDPVDETRIGAIDRQSPRSSYALGKLATEYIVFFYSR
ncbi:MAG: NAD(P)-dependent oxidoreductase [Muribaculaceae bacterium]|nr:NAD(P)-dependent oxidoreductase [Muribaculaceae bacterium]